MNDKQLDILLKRERLRERIRIQRSELSRHVWPVVDVLAGGDRVVAGVGYLRERPWYFVTVAFVAALLRPRAIFRWGKRGFFIWRAWRGLRRQLSKVLTTLM